MARVLSLVVLALLTVTAGCFAAPTGAGQTQATTAGTTAGSSPTDSRASHLETVGNLPPKIGSLDRLYRKTIDSVVQLKVVHTNGRTSIGSGFVYDSQGRIVTNQHVVQNAATVMVRFRNGKWRIGQVIGTDIYTDLAVVDVDDVPQLAEPLPVAERDIQPGEPVVALGSPFGLEGTITHGIVSGVNRSMPTSLGFTIPDTIQFDAAINPGNSGGPLLSLNGTVVGVTRATRGTNVGFAISADVVERVVPALIETGVFHHPYLGVRTETVTPIIAAANGLETARGVIVTRLLPNAPAKGVIQPAGTRYTETGRAIPVNGDIIVKIDSREINTRQALARYLLLHTRPGETVEIVVLRDGERVTRTVELGTRPEYPGS